MDTVCKYFILNIAYNDIDHTNSKFRKMPQLNVSLSFRLMSTILPSNHSF